MEIQGKIKEIFDTQQIKSTFQKREFVVEYVENPQYPQYIKFEVVQDKCDILNNFQVGDEVQVAFNLRGRMWTNREGITNYFNSLQAWKIDKMSSTAPGPDAAAASGDAPPPSSEPNWLQGDEAEDDLPF